MKNDNSKFPFNYFLSTITPIRAFANRNNLKWYQIIIIIIFLNSLISIPMTLHYATENVVNIENLYPEVFELVNEETAAIINQSETENIVVNDDSVVVINPSQNYENYTEGFNTYLVVSDDEFIFTESGQPEISIFTDHFFENTGEVNADIIVHEINRFWENQNRVFIVLFFSILISLATLAMLVSLIAGSAFFMSLTKKSKVTDINSFKESLIIVLNSLGIPTLVAMLIGFIDYNIITMMTIQMLGLVIMILTIYYKTQFKSIEKEPDLYKNK